MGGGPEFEEEGGTLLPLRLVGRSLDQDEGQGSLGLSWEREKGGR